LKFNWNVFDTLGTFDSCIATCVLCILLVNSHYEHWENVLQYKIEFGKGENVKKNQFTVNLSLEIKS